MKHHPPINIGATFLRGGIEFFAFCLLTAVVLVIAMDPDLRSQLRAALSWFCFHAARGLALMAVSTVGTLLVASDWAKHRRRRRRESGDFTLKGISRADQAAFVDAIRILHADLVRAGERAEKRRTEREGP